MIALCTTGLDQYTTALWIGNHSIGHADFFLSPVVLCVGGNRYNMKGKAGFTLCFYLLAAVRIILCLFPQNAWTSAEAPLSWGIYRNIPFALIGVLIIVLFYQYAKEREDKSFRFMWLTIVLSFGFYLPVVLWADVNPLIGMLMIPKTCAYVWTVLIGYFDMTALPSIRAS